MDLGGGGGAESLVDVAVGLMVVSARYGGKFRKWQRL